MLLADSPRARDRLVLPLLREEEETAKRRRGRGHAALRRAIAAVASDLQLQKIGELRRPELSAAEDHVRFFLPKDEQGGLLPLRCSEEEFSAHVGAGVALYMRFVRMTGYVFAAAAVVAIPQIVGNAAGTRLHLRWPWSIECEQAMPDGTPPLAHVAAQLGGATLYGILSTLLGNASLGEGTWVDGAHLFSASTLCAMFCIYVFWTWRMCSASLAAIDASRTRASDFAVRVSGLPNSYTDTHAVKAHFSFFGPIASVALSVDNAHLLALLERQHALAQDWRKLHTHHALLAPAQRARASRSLLRRAEHMLSRLTRARAALRAELRAPSDCTGTAFVVFRRRPDAARCVRHFELIQRHERSRDGGLAGANVDFRQLYFRTAHKLAVSRACEPSDVLWRSLRYTKASARAANVKTTALVFLVACGSTAAITTANFMGTSHSTGALTTLWVTAVVIASNLAIFSLVPYLAVKREHHHHRSAQHMHMLLKMAGFQIMNTSVSVLAFLFLTWDVTDNTACPLPLPVARRAATDFTCSTWLVGGRVGGVELRYAQAEVDSSDHELDTPIRLGLPHRRCTPLALTRSLHHEVSFYGIQPCPAHSPPWERDAFAQTRIHPRMDHLRSFLLPQCP